MPRIYSSTSSLNSVKSDSGIFRYYTWKADGTERLNEMPIPPPSKLLEVEQLKKENGASAASLCSSIGCQTEDEEASPPREPIDDHYVGKNLVFAKDGSTIVKKNSISHFVKDINREEITRARLNSISGPTDDKPMPEARVLVLYTGGTVGMKCKANGVYEPEPHYLPLAIRDIPPLNDKEYVEKYYGDYQVQPYSLPPVRTTGFPKFSIINDSADAVYASVSVPCKTTKPSYS
jgi:hypothetical protein